MMRRLIVSTLVWTFGASLAACDEPLVWRFEEGQTLVFRSEQESRSTVVSADAETQTSSKQVTDFTWNVEQVAPDGAATIRQDITRIQLRFSAPGGQDYTFDTQSDASAEGIAALVSPVYRELEAQDATLGVSPRGVLNSLEPPADLAAVLEAMPNSETLGDAKGLYRQFLTPLLVEFPAGELEEGASWETQSAHPLPVAGETRVTTTFRYAGVRDQGGQTVAVIEPAVQILAAESGGENSRIQLELLDASGELLFDRQAGRVTSSKLSTKLDFQFKLGEETVNGTVEQTSTITSDPAADGQ